MMDIKRFKCELPTIPFVRISSSEGGCGLDKCQCSPGFWISIGDKKGGIQVRFTSKEEMMEILGLGRNEG